MMQKVKMKKHIINTEDAPKPVGPYSQAVKAGNLIFISGQIPIDPKKDALVVGDFTAETRQVFDNIEAVCRAASIGLENVVKLNIFLTDLSNFDEVNQAMLQRFSAPFPARATIQVSKLPMNVNIEIDAIAVLET